MSEQATRLVVSSATAYTFFTQWRPVASWHVRAANLRSPWSWLPMMIVTDDPMRTAKKRSKINVIAWRIWMCAAPESMQFSVVTLYLRLLSFAAATMTAGFEWPVSHSKARAWVGCTAQQLLGRPVEVYKCVVTTVLRRYKTSAVPAMTSSGRQIAQHLYLNRSVARMCCKSARHLLTADP